MLPSQFQDELKKEEDAKKQLKVRLEVAKYFQDVVAERAKTVRDSNVREVSRSDPQRPPVVNVQGEAHVFAFFWGCLYFHPEVFRTDPLTTFVLLLPLAS